ncbi:MAG: AbrB/MazE/SpoVT family DNA-binding domain-containing protein [Clostridia bacterium]|nr:AbrB/MazE/SpoVT family DNA-binding domain-containing protein [Clostridia bacterium]
MKGIKELSTVGLVKEIDRMGRIVIPKEMRDFLNLDCGSEVEVLLTTEGILVRNPKYEIVPKKSK